MKNDLTYLILTAAIIAGVFTAILNSTPAKAASTLSTDASSAIISTQN